MQEMYEGGATLRDVAAAAGCSPQTARRRLEAADVQIRTYRPQPGQGQSSDYDEMQLRKWSAQGLTCQEIGQRLGKTAEAVRRAMVRRGVPRQESRPLPERNHFWTGGWTVDKHGYVLIRRPDHPEANHLGYVRHHRLVMEQELGRHLRPEEVVDHHNGDTSDNRPANLRLFGSNAEHLRATLTGRAKLSRVEREERRREAVRRARQRVAAILSGSGSDALGSLRPSTRPR